MENRPKLQLIEVTRHSRRQSGAEEGAVSENRQLRRRQDGSGTHHSRTQTGSGEHRSHSVGRYKDYGSVSLGQLPSSVAGEEGKESAALPDSGDPVVPSAAPERTEDRYAFVLKRNYRKRNRAVPYLVFGGLAVLLIGLLLAVLLRSGGSNEKPLPRPEEASMAQESIDEQNDEMIHEN